jgi:tetratricopeptide (TPR) repeat protein
LKEIGQLAAAERAYQLGLEVGGAAGDQERIDAGYRNLLGLYATMGAWAEGEAAYSALQASPDDSIKSATFTALNGAQLRWGQVDDPAPLLAEALRRARHERFLRAERMAQRLSGEVTFSRGDVEQAREAWQAAYVIAQRQGVLLGPYLADLARWHATKREAAQAKALIAEALALGGRGVALAAVEVFTALGEAAEAKRHLDAAYREAWADGPPYAFAYELKRIRAALKTLGMAEPHRPPFDPAKVAAVPYEVEIRAFIDELKHEKGTEETEETEATPSIETGKTVDALTPVSQNGHAQPSEGRPWWQFWSQR